MKPTEWIWMNGEWKRWGEATVHVSAHVLHYGSSVFEGIRAYETPDGISIFRLREHIERLFDSARLLRLDVSTFSVDELMAASVELVGRNHEGSCYLRPLLFRDTGALGVDGRGCPTSAVIFSIEWGRYLGPEAIEEGVDAGVSSWRRFAPGSLSALGKIGGQYVNNQYASMEARDNGFTEAIMLDYQGLVSEGGGENLFVVKNGGIVTPPATSSILAGITRDSVLTLAADLGFEIREATISRDMLYLADEIFMTGTAAELTPVRSVDRVPVGRGRRGPVTQRLQQEFFAVVSGRTEDRHGWLTSVASRQNVSPPAPQGVQLLVSPPLVPPVGTAA